MPPKLEGQYPLPKGGKDRSKHTSQIHFENITLKQSIIKFGECWLKHNFFAELLRMLMYTMNLEDKDSMCSTNLLTLKPFIFNHQFMGISGNTLGKH